MKKHSLDPLIKDTAFPNNQCTSMHGISTITWCQSLRLLMYVCAQHIIFPCNPLLCFLPLCLRAGISLVKGSNCKADYFTAWDMTWSDLKGKLIQICSNNLSQETSKENGILYHLTMLLHWDHDTADPPPDLRSMWLKDMKTCRSEEDNCNAKPVLWSLRPLKIPYHAAFFSFTTFLNSHQFSIPY